MGIVTDGLIGYWHYQQGVSGSAWNNIAPATSGIYDGQIFGAILQSDGMYFDGVDDYINFNSFAPLVGLSEFTIDIVATNPYDLNVRVLFGMYVNSSTRLSLGYYEEKTYISMYRSGLSEIFGVKAIPYGNRSFVLTMGAEGRKTYIDGVFDVGDNYTFAFPLTIPSKVVVGAATASLSRNNFFKGKIIAIRIYNKSLTQTEITQNYSVGVNVGLVDEPTQSPPSVTIVNIDAPTPNNKMSDEPNMDRATITFKFDKDVTEWRVRTVGSDHETGTLADSGGAVAANTNIIAEVDWTELYQEGQNRINIYGKGIDGQWTAYNS